MILEGIVTTLGEADRLNVAPMGPRVDADMGQLLLRPFRTSTTYRNLKDRGEGVFHVTDDVLLIARTAVGVPVEPPTRPAGQVRGRILEGACRYYEFRVAALDDREERTTIQAEVVAQGRLRDFFGFNRAKHAVIEAAILATRVAILPMDEILADMRRLAVLVEKTGGAAEREAFDLLGDHVSDAARAAGRDPGGLRS